MTNRKQHKRVFGYFEGNRQRFLQHQRHNPGHFSLPRKTGMPVPGAAFRLGPCGTGLAATFQATTCRRSRRGVSRYAAGTLPCGSNHVRYTRDTPSPLGLSPHTGPAVARPPLKKGQPSATPSPFGLIPKGWPGLRPANGLNSRPYPPCRRARAAPVARG